MPHIHHKYDYTVSAFIVHDGRVLLVHHPRYDKWLPIGGHVDLEEDPEEALFKEIQEETSLKPEEIEILSTKLDIKDSTTKHIYQPNYIDVHDANPPHKHIAFIYFVKSKHDGAVISDEHADMQWLAAKELQNPKYKLSPSLKFYATEAIKAGQARVEH